MKTIRLIILVLVYSTILTAQDKPDPLSLQRLNGTITIDGLSDEAAWENIEPLPLTMYLPEFEGEMTERSEIRVAYDDEYLYASGRFYDGNPELISAKSYKRDGVTPGSDLFAITLDTFNDNQTSLAFYTTATASRSDMVFSNDAEGSGYSNISWNTYWDAATIRNEEGWFVEVRIPFSSLRFQAEDGDVIMGLMVWRWIARKGEMHSYPALDPNKTNAHYKASLCTDVELKGVYSRKPLYATPYLLGGFGKSFDLNADESDYDPIKTNERNIGLDLKYGLTNNLTLDLTLNTDFAQVEADDQRINLSRYSLFYPEKRMFFQERASIFNFSFDGFSRMFHSRRIGYSSYGNIPIYGGARLIGRIGEWDLGMLDMATAATSFGDDDVPGENFGVLRLQRRVYNENSYMGGMLTSRTGDDGSYNHVFGLDGTIRVFGDEYVNINMAQSWDEATEGSVSGLDLDAAKIRFQWERRTALGVGYLFNYARRGENYRPDMGFESRSNYSTFQSKVGYAWLTHDSPKAYSYSIGLVGNMFRSNVDDAIESANIGAEWSYTGKDFSTAGIDFMGRQELIPQGDTLWLPQEAFVPSGTFNFYEITASHNPASAKKMHAVTKVVAGTFYDGWKLSTTISPTWNISEFFTLSGSYSFDKGWFSVRSMDFSNHIIRLRSLVTLSTVYSGIAFIQYNRAADAIGINLRLRYNPSEGTDLYLVYDEGLNTNLDRESPALPLTSTRTLIMKYSTTFLTDLTRKSR